MINIGNTFIMIQYILIQNYNIIDNKMFKKESEIKQERHIVSVREIATLLVHFQSVSYGCSSAFSIGSYLDKLPPHY